MKTRLFVSNALLVATGLFLFAATAGAAEIKVMSSAGFKAAYLELAAEFERTTGHKIVNAWGPSMGSTPQAVPNRTARSAAGAREWFPQIAPSHQRTTSRA
jgi:accessory colonization factor AcfC